MTNITILHNESKNSIFLHESIRKYMSKKSENYTVKTYTPSNFNSDVYEKSDMLFIIISKGQKELLYIAGAIRNSNMRIPMIFITDTDKYCKIAFSFHVFDYLLEPINSQKIAHVLDDLFFLNNASKDNCLMLNTDNGITCVDLKDINYIVVNKKRTIMIQTSSGSVMAKGTITDIFTHLNEPYFFQTRRDCIVNMNRVNSIINDYVIVMKNGDMLPLAQKKKKDFIQELTNYISINYKKCHTTV